MNFPSQFTIYEVLRVIIPGFYIITMIETINSILVDSKIILFKITVNTVDTITITIVLTILIGGLIYSLDLPRMFKDHLKYLPTNMIKNELNADFTGPRHREGENNYYNYYYSLRADRKVKTEIQSGFYHFFINISFISYFFSIIFLALFISLYILNSYNAKALLYFILNRIILSIGIISAISIYYYRLRFTWLRDFENYRKFRSIKNKRT